MSTRSIIVVTGPGKYSGPTTIRLYKHCDGYPTGNLPFIHNALKRGLAMVEKHNNDYKDIKRTQRKLNAETVAGLIIGESTSVYGLGAFIDTDYDKKTSYARPACYHEPFKPEHLGSQVDLEWIYIIDLDAKTLNIYSSGFSIEAPQHAYKAGPVDPLSYADCLYPEYQERERKRTIELLSAIEALGFKVNPKTKAKTKSSRSPRSKRAKQAHKKGEVR